jgi:hypothetical protein
MSSSGFHLKCLNGCPYGLELVMTARSAGPAARSRKALTPFTQNHQPLTIVFVSIMITLINMTVKYLDERICSAVSMLTINKGSIYIIQI